MPSDNSLPEEDLLPFGAPEEDPVNPSVRAKLNPASPGKQKVRRSGRALRPLLYSIPFLVIALVASAYLIGVTLWSRSSLGHWKAQEYEAAQVGYEGQMKWTAIGIERWVAHYNLGTTLTRQNRVDEGVAELRTAFELVPKAIEVKPGRLEAFSYECRVRVNLGIGIEIQGDILNAAGSHSEAANTYQEAEELISPCQSTSNGGQSGQSGNQGQSGGQGQSGDKQQSGGESDNPADKNKSRVEDKKQKAEEQSEDRSDSDSQQQGQQQDQGQQNQQPSPSPSPKEDPYQGESKEQKKRREDLQNQNENRGKEQREKRDEGRVGNPKGAW